MALQALQGFDLWVSPPSGAITGSPDPSLSSLVVAYADTVSKSLYFGAGGGILAGFSGYYPIATIGGSPTELIGGINFQYRGSLPSGTSPGGTTGIFAFFGVDAGSSSNKIVIEIGIDSSGILHITNGVSGPNGAVYASGTHALIPGCWYHIDFQADLSSSVGSGACFLNLNATLEASVPSGTNTTNSATYSFAALGGIAVGFYTTVDLYGLTVYFDDAYLFDTTGSSDNSPYGFGHVHSVSPSTQTLTAEDKWEAGSLSSLATFTGTAASTAKRASTVSSEATFTGTAASTAARVSSVSSSATFSYTAASIPVLPTGRVGWIGARLSQLGNITLGCGANRGRFISASASDSFTGSSAPLETHVGTHSLSTADSARFTGSANSTHHLFASASDSANLFENLTTKGHWVVAFDAAIMSSEASTPLRALGADSFYFDDTAWSGGNKSVSASSSATFSDAASGWQPTVWTQHVQDSFVFL